MIGRGGERAPTADGQIAEVITEPPDMAAFNRYRDGDFNALDRIVANGWRQSIDAIDLDATAELIRGDSGRLRFTDLKALQASAFRKPCAQRFPSA